jgi:hypothetical protein
MRGRKRIPISSFIRALGHYLGLTPQCIWCDTLKVPTNFDDVCLIHVGHMLSYHTTRHGVPRIINRGQRGT